MRAKIILCDLDHTVADAAWRDPLLGEWDEYHARAIHDKPIYPMVRLLHSLHKMEHPIVGITSRPEKWRKQSTEWLLRWGIPITDIIMRPDDCYMQHAEMKLWLAKKAYGENLKDEILMIFDNNLEVIEAFHAEGVQSFHVYGSVW